MRAIARLGAVLLLAGAAACEADYHDDLVQQASKLPPQDTLAGSYAPAPSSATGGAAATPAQPNAQPVTAVAAGGATAPATSGAAAGGAAKAPAGKAPAGAKK